jgi:putative redox protein
MAAVQTQIGKDRYRTTVQSESGHTIVADEPLAFGGNNEGFSPDELLAASLATCGIITMRMYADRKGWPLESIELDVTIERPAGSAKTVFNKKIKFNGALSPEEQERLLNIGDRCPVQKTLLNPIDISSVIIP